MLFGDVRVQSKYDQDSIILEWFRYSTSAERGGNTQGPNKGRMNYYHLPYDGNHVDDDNSLQVLCNHRLCTAGMQAVMSNIGYDQMQSIQMVAEMTGLIPHHASVGAKGHLT
jgi:hypothetical protein